MYIFNFKWREFKQSLFKRAVTEVDNNYFNVF